MKATRLEIDEGVATLTLERPKQRNAIDADMSVELADVVTRVRDDDDIRALVITGAGGAFSAGGDIRHMVATRDDQQARRARLRRLHGRLEPLINLPKPVIAAVDGVAYGAGFGLALAADIVIATPRASFCMVFLKVGLVPDFAALYTLPRAVGLQRAKALMFSTEPIDAQQALDYGIVMELHDAEALLNRAQALAAAFTQASPVALALTKQALNVSCDSDLRSMLAMEFSGQSLAFTTDEHNQAIDRFLAKESPVFEWPE